jgi:hypothetical protein
VSESSPERALLELQRAAGVIGAYCAVERALFELTGSMARDPDLAARAAVLLDALSGEHAWHAELWADRLPVLSGVDAQALVVLPSPLPAVFAELGSGSLLARAIGLFRVVLPRLVTSYQRHLRSASATAERPTRRALRLVLRDEIEAWAGGEAQVEALLRTPGDVEAAAQAQRSLETRLVEAGVAPGLVPWPGQRA